MVLVLAIAGLIFVMVFVALPALQRSQRDSQRRQDVSRLAAALDNYKVANKGKLSKLKNKSCSLSNSKNLNPSNPTTTNPTCLLIAQYLNSGSSTTNEFKDPDGSAYDVYVRTWAASRAAANSNYGHRIYVNLGAKCNGEVSEETSHENEYAILLKLEGAGAICVDNQ